VRAAWPGREYPLGAHWDGEGTNFVLFSAHAEAVELVLVDAHGTATSVELIDRTDFQWHGYVYGVGPGQRYGYRVHGPYEPSAGLRFNSAKLLLDPYSRAITGSVQWGPEVFGYRWGGDGSDEVRSELDSLGHTPLGVVVDGEFPWGDDRRPEVPLADTVIYEAHVRGMSMRHPDVPAELRGTFAGIAHPAILDHFSGLGITAVELMPVHHFLDPGHLVEQGLRNYWGYDSLGYFAPEARFSAGGSDGEQVREFKAMVRALHRAGLEVILDVVYNHTAEGNHLGPTLSLRGIDNPSYYRLVEDDPRFYFDVTGTGNSINVRQPQSLQLIMDSLRYWVTEMHVDGFRFDLASALARQFHDVDRLSAFFDIIHQDPVLSRVKLIAEPWDVGEGGYQVGNFPVLWTEWNGKYRDSVRRFWKGDGATVAEFATRGPSASINFITAHDGFTLRDLVSHDDKHNLANGEDNRDGADDNRSWNCGAEGDTDDPGILELRRRQQRNMLTTLLLSLGSPMLLHGDELGRTQQGNNNAYCQDNEISWIDWPSADLDLLAFTRRVIALRRAQPVFRRRRFAQGQLGRAAHLKDLVWLRRNGEEMGEADWAGEERLSVGMLLNGDLIAERGPRGEAIRGDTLLILLHAHHEETLWQLPRGWGERWEVLIDTAARGEGRSLGEGEALPVQGRSVVVLRRDVAGAEPSAGG